MSRILVADDDLDVLEVISIALRRAGHDVRQAHDGFEAARLAAAHDLDALVLDVVMPGRSGIDVALGVRADLRCPQPCIVLMSSLGSRAEVRAGFVAGADEYLVKPFRPSELVERIALLLLERFSLSAD